MKISHKVFTSYILVSLFIFLVTGGTAYFIARQAIENRILNQLSAISRIQKNRIEELMRQNQDRMNLITSRTQLRMSLSSYLYDPKPEHLEKIHRILNDAQKSIRDIFMIEVVSMDGKVSISSGKTSSTKPQQNGTPATQTTWKTGDLVFYTNSLNQLTVVFSSALYLDNQPIGRLVLHTSAESILRLTQDYTGLGETGETLLGIRWKNGDALFLTPLRFDPEAGLKKRISGAENKPIIKALNGMEGFFNQTTDYRNKPVLACTGYLRDAGIGLVVKIDQKEALAPVRKLTVLFLFIGAGFIFLIVVLASLMARSILRPIRIISQGAQKIGKGDLDFAIEINSKDEIAILSQTINQMVSDLKSVTTSKTVLDNEIMDRKQKEKQLSQSLAQAQFFSNIIINSQQPMGIGYPDGSLGFCNKAFCELTGYSEAELKTMDWSKVLTPPEWLPGEMAALERLEKTGVPVQYEKEYIRKDGRRVPIEMFVQMDSDPEGGGHYYYAFITDITDRKAYEKKIIKQKKKAEQYLNHAGVMFIGLDPDGCVNLTNRKACEVLECETADIIGMDWFDTFVPDSMTDRLKSDFQSILTRKTVLSDYFESPVLTKTGREKQISWHNTFITGEDGQITGVLSSGQDISEKKELQMQLHQAQKLESIGNLAGGIAHDFNNILSSIIGFNELAMRKIEPGTELADDLQEVQKASQRAKDLVWQILTFARKTDAPTKPIQIYSLLKEVLKFIRSSIPATIEIQQRINSDSFIRANLTQIHQIIMNLCTNAAQAMEDAGGVMRVSLQDVIIDESHQKLKPGEYIELIVSDTGTGIAPDILDSIFEPYFTTKSSEEGTGLGLALVQGIIEQHQGDISVESQQGTGSTFTVHLPITKKRRTEPSAPQKPLPGGVGKILFVDDETSITKMGRRILESLGYEVTAMTSSTEALALFRSDPGGFDVVVTDMTMPDLTGDRMAVEMMNIRPDIPVVLCTGYSRKMTEKKAMSLGIRAFITKPIFPLELATTIKRLIPKTAG